MDRNKQDKVKENSHKNSIDDRLKVFANIIVDRIISDQKREKLFINSSENSSKYAHSDNK